MWNYRIVRTVYNNNPNGNDDQYAIHEVYYEEDNDTHPDSVTSEATTLTGESLEEIRTNIDRIIKAFDKPVLEYQMFEDMGNNTEAKNRNEPYISSNEVRQKYGFVS